MAGCTACRDVGQAVQVLQGLCNGTRSRRSAYLMAGHSLAVGAAPLWSQKSQELSPDARLCAKRSKLIRVASAYIDLAQECMGPNSIRMPPAGLSAPGRR